MDELTERQATVLAFIEGFILAHGIPPTHAEIARGLGFRSTNGPKGHLQALARKGFIDLVPDTSRGIRLRADATAVQPSAASASTSAPASASTSASSWALATASESPWNEAQDQDQDQAQDQDSAPAHECPAVEQADALAVIGRVAAGNPVLAIENVEDYLGLRPEVFHPRADYLLRVHGMSMRDAGILDGDLVAVHRTGELLAGRIMVVRLDDEVTVKRVAIETGAILLEAANPAFPTRHLRDGDHQVAIEGLVVGVIRRT